MSDTTSARIILASASPRRSQLLAQAGYAFKVDAAHIDESRRDSEDPGPYVVRLAQEKAKAVFARHGEEDTAAAPLLVLGADTCVVCDSAGANEILNKPADAADAGRMLRMLSGRAHVVLTGLAVRTRAGILSHVESTEVHFAPIPEPEIVLYCATPEPLDKAGAYGIQGFAARWVPRIDGCYFNVVGLPIAQTVRLLEAAAAISPKA